MKQKSEFDAPLLRAIIRAVPEFFSWPAGEQDRYRLNLPSEVYFSIRRSLLHSLLGIDVATESKMDEVERNLDYSQHLLVNRSLLPLQGIGDNDFFLNECMRDGTTLLDFESVGDYARDDHAFQQRARKEEYPNYEVRPWRGDLYPCWARLNIENEFYYATLISEARYVVDVLDEKGAERIDELIPHRYIEGTEHGKRSAGGRRWDFRVDAAGMEPQLDDLRRRHYEYVNRVLFRLEEQLNADRQRRVYIDRKESESDPHIDFVFSDGLALDAVRFRHFFKDCQRIAAPDFGSIRGLIEKEVEAALLFIDEQHRDILENFDPTVVPLGKKRKIMVADRVWSDLF